VKALLKETILAIQGCQKWAIGLLSLGLSLSGAMANSVPAVCKDRLMKVAFNQLGLSAAYISYRDSSGQTVKAQYLGVDANGNNIVEKVDGVGSTRAVMSTSEAKTASVSKTAQLLFERTGEPATDSFRASYRMKYFADASNYISFIDKSSNQRLMAKILRMRSDGSIDVLMLNQVAVNLSKGRLLTARISQKSAAAFGAGQAVVQVKPRPVAAPVQAPPPAVNYGRRLPSPFAGQTGMSFDSPSLIKSVKIAGTRLTINYNLQQRDNNKIREFPSGSAVQLAVGQYTFIVLEDGTLVTGQVTDSLELGVKHFHLANGRRVVTAGELNIWNNGNAQFNVTSGTFSLRMINQGSVTQADLISRTGLYLQNSMNRSVTYANNQDLLPSTPISGNQLKVYCGIWTFQSVNQNSCCQAAGICH
jgi:hypothetical protein